MISDQEIIDRFRAAMAEAGMIVNEPLLADGVLHRVQVEGDKPGHQNGAYILNLDGSGYFEHFPSSLRELWDISGQCEPLTPSMARQIEAERKRRNLERKNRQWDAAKQARFIWSKANPIFRQEQHPYLILKGIRSHQARRYRGSLVIPLYDESQELWNLQFIDAKGNTRCLPGGKRRGCFSVMGKPPYISEVVICESFADGAILYERWGGFVMVALDADNFSPVARIARRLFPYSEIIIACANDKIGKGKDEAHKAAQAVCGGSINPIRKWDTWNEVFNGKLSPYSISRLRKSK